jgi:broad specificity phosphatase PhoE
VLRHGESKNNVLGIISTLAGETDVYGLTERGVAQVESVAAERHAFSLILHSPLRRAVETAGILSKAWGAPASTDERLIEVYLGVFDGRPEAEYRAWKLETGQWVPPLGESDADAQKRIRELLAVLDAEHPNASLLLVTHGTLLHHLFSIVFDEVNWEEYRSVYEDGRRLFELRDHDPFKSVHRRPAPPNPGLNLSP